MESILSIFIICCTSFIGPSMGVYEDELNYCPPTPNCVSSQSWKYNVLHKSSPYVYKESREEAYKKLYDYFMKLENVNIRKETNADYIRVFYFTKVFRFPDKVEFYFEKDTNKIQVRSASVFGIWDIFHNRARVEWIRKDMGWE
jgi:uncharacterized protein (DUF1499 family)